MLFSCLILLFAASAHAQVCAGGNCDCSQLSCQLCGDLAEQIGCYAYEADFESPALIEDSFISSYNNASWSEFVTLPQHNTGNGAIEPASPIHYGAVASGQTGLIRFCNNDANATPDCTIAPGAIIDLYYACAAPDGADPPNPIPCNITVSGLCSAPGGSYEPSTFTIQQYVLSYDPSQSPGMAYSGSSFPNELFVPEDDARLCSSYTFDAYGTAIDYDNEGNVILPPIGTPGPVIMLDNIRWITFPGKLNT